MQLDILASSVLDAADEFRNLIANPVYVHVVASSRGRYYSLSQIIRCHPCHAPLWRNWLARSAVNRKVGGSNPPRGGAISFFKAQEK